MTRANRATMCVKVGLLFVAITTLSCVTPSEISLTVLVNTDKRIPVRPGVLGVNGQLLFGGIHYSTELLADLYDDAGFTNIRFPGGTVANYYNPDTGLFDCEKATTEKSIKQIAQFNQAVSKIAAGYGTDSFLHFVEQTGTDFGLVVNVACRGPTSTQRWLRSIDAAGQVVSHAEMGNELEFRQYDWAFPDASSYLAAAAPHAKAVTETFPDARIGVVMSNALFTTDESAARLLRKKRSAFRLDFLNIGPPATFADAVILHLYGRPQGRQKKQPDDIMTAYQNALSHFDVRFPITLDFARQTAHDKEIWISEWSIVPRADRNDDLDLRLHPIFGLYIANAVTQYLLSERVAIANFHNMSILWQQQSQEPRVWMRDIFAMYTESVSNCGHVARVETNGAQDYIAPATSYDGQASDVQAIYFDCGNEAQLYLINKMGRAYRVASIDVPDRNVQVRHTSLFSPSQPLESPNGWTKEAAKLPVTLPPYSILRMDLDTGS